MSSNTFSVTTLEDQVKSSFAKSFKEYLFALLLSVFCSLVILRIGDIQSLYFPFNYFGDTIFYAMTIKSVITTGWYLSDPTIGVPGGHFLGDFPTPEGLNYLLIKLISLFTSNWALVLNLFFLLGFPLITLSALFVLRSFGLSFPFALTAVLLYCFLPYHLIKDESHLFLSGYYIPPLAIWLAVRTYQDNLFPDKKKIRLFFCCLIAVLMGSNGVYYAYFGAFFILLGGCIGSYANKRWRPLKYAVIFIVIIAASIAANIWPTVANQWKNGSNYQVIQRCSMESEIYGLKIAQLLLPRDNDRLFSSMKNRYNRRALSVNENTTASLGLVGSLGFLGLLAAILFKKRTSSNALMDALAHFNISAVLLATMGGFSSLIALFSLPGIRNYNRICVFISFFALAAFFLFLQKHIKNRKLIWSCSSILLLFGLYNQSSDIDAPHKKFPQLREDYLSDQEFVQRIENAMPPGSMIFQLPYISFPEGKRTRINSYAHFKGPLHSHSLKWSFGAMKGRKTDRWQKKTSRLKIKEMIPVLLQQGFTGLYIDKFGYVDDGQSIELQLIQLLNKPPIFDKHGRSFWDLRSYSLQTIGLEKRRSSY